MIDVLYNSLWFKIGGGCITAVCFIIGIVMVYKIYKQLDIKNGD